MPMRKTDMRLEKMFRQQGTGSAIDAFKDLNHPLLTYRFRYFRVRIQALVDYVWQSIGCTEANARDNN